MPLMLTVTIIVTMCEAPTLWQVLYILEFTYSHHNLQNRCFFILQISKS